MDLFNPNPNEQPERAQSLYRKWRSQTFAELVGQEHVVRTLMNALSSGRLVHAYLFTGPRGTGKTSTARLLAKAVNCLHYSPAAMAVGQPVPCGACDNCLAITEGRAIDLVEIDAASNTGVDDVRILRDGVNFSPSIFRYRVYIIDEVHMLSTAAFNALLKTLEEPPAHALFILATTEVHKIPATVLSRVQRYDLRRIPLAEMVSRMAYICDQEGIAYEPLALELIARSATGSLRDAESLMDQLISYSGQNITLAAAQDMLGASGNEQVAAFVDDIIAHDLTAGLGRINDLLTNGVDMRQFNRQLVDYLRNLMLLKAGGPDLPALDMTAEAMQQLKQQASTASLSALVAWVKTFVAADDVLRTTPYGQLPLEVAFVEATLTESNDRLAEAPRPTARHPYQQPAPPAPTMPTRPSYTESATGQSTPPPQPATPRPPAADHDHTEPPPAQPPRQAAQPTPPLADPNPLAAQAIPAALTADASSSQAITYEQLRDKWSMVIDRIGARSKFIQSLLRDCILEAYENHIVSLRPKFPFHYEKLEQRESKTMIEESFTKLFGKGHPVHVVFLAVANETTPASNAESTSAIVRRDERVRAAMNIFTGTIREVREVR